MKKLSIIIRADEKDIKAYLKVLDMLLSSFQTELIFVSDRAVEIDTPYKYSSYSFSGRYYDFKKYCFSSTTGDRLMIIENGVVITDELVCSIKNLLECEEYLNISCSLKTYLCDDKSIFFLREEVLVYTRGIKGFNKNTGITVDDFSLTNIDENNIEAGIEKLVDGGYYNELYRWYENSILRAPVKHQAAFCLMLESKKSVINYCIRDKIEAIFKTGLNDFIKSNIDIKDTDHCSKYKSYIEIKRLLRDKDTDYDQIAQMVKDVSFTESELYWSYLIKELKVDKPSFAGFIELFTIDRQKSFLHYMLCNDETFNDSVYHFITEDTEVSEYNTETYVNIMEAYIDYIKGVPESPECKKKLINVFDNYIDYIVKNKFSVNVDMSGCNVSIADSFSKAKSLIKHQKVEEAFNVLEYLSAEYIDEFKIIRYYTQKLRYETQYYPYLLSICMIVKDEGKNLDRCLSGLKPIIDSGIAELIIVDTGSIDNTIEIAKEYTAKVYTHPWNNDFSEARNFSILFAEGRYIFIVDGDEELKRDDAQKIIDEFLADGTDRHNTFTVKLVSFTNTELTQYAVLTQPRIFKNNGLFCYSSIVHNQPALELPVKHLDIELLHYGYIMTEDIREKKFQRTSGMLKAELQRNPQNIYYRFQLSTSYAMYGSLKEALKHVEIYMRLIKEQGLTDDTLIMYYNNAATIYIDNFKYDEAERVSDEGLALQPDFIDFIYYKAYILFIKEKYSDALIYIRKYLSLADDYYSMDIANDGRFSIYTLSFKDEITKLLIVTSYRLCIYDDCIINIDKIVNEKILQNCIHEIIGACVNTGNYLKLAEFYTLHFKNTAGNDFKYVFSYFLKAELSKLTESEKQGCISAFIEQGIDSEYISFLYSDSQYTDDYDSILLLISKYDMDGMDFDSVWSILKKILKKLESYEVQEDTDPTEILPVKRAIQFILHRTEKLISPGIIDVERLITIFQKYMFLCSVLSNTGSLNLLETRERLFIGNVLIAFDELRKENYTGAVDYMRDAAMYYNDMNGVIELSMQILIPGYCPSNETPYEYHTEANNEVSKYIGDIKGRIACIPESSQAKYILDIFNEYDKAELYDAELICIKAIALISLDMLDEARECIEGGLERYGDEPNLLYNLSILYSLKNDYKHSTEIYSRMKMKNPCYSNTALYETIQKSIRDLSWGSKKVLHGTMDVSNKTNALVSMLRNKGIFARSFNYLTKAGYSSDYVIDANTFDSGETIRNRSIDAASKLISEYDIFHFHYGTTLYFDHSDLPVIKEFNKKMLMQYYGDEVRLNSIASKLSPYIDMGGRNDDETKRKLEMVSKYISCCIVNNYEVNEYVKDYFEKTIIINPMIDIQEYKPAPVSIKNGVFTIVHAPASYDLKGTKYIMNAVEALKAKYKIDLRIVQGLPLQKAIRIYREADLIIDGLIMGSYGQFAVEAMALCKPVICFISEFMSDKYPESLPVISANPDNIEERIEYCINNRDMLYTLGTNGRAYVEKYHNADNEIEKIIELYKGITQKCQTPPSRKEDAK